MPKHRPQPKPKGQSTAAEDKTKRAVAAAPVRPAPPPPPPAPPAAPARRSTYFEAVALYEKGLEALQRHDYSSAIDQLDSVLRQYPEEKELHERVRLYLNICRRQAVPRENAPQTLDEKLYAATLAINGGRYEEALTLLRLVRDEDADNDHALYMLAVAHAQRQEFAEALAHLQRAVSLNPENRSLARRDPDLEPLRGNDEFRAVLDAPAMPAVRPLDRRRPFRPRSGR
jgi:tetratricopeptide (TPR) repeat protein